MKDILSNFHRCRGRHATDGYYACDKVNDMKGSKIWLTIAIIMMVAGLGLAAIGTSQGGSWRFKIKNFKMVTTDDEYITKTIDYNDSEAFKKIIVDSKTTDINIQKGKSYSVTYSVPEDSIPEIKNQNGILEINTTEDDGFIFFDFSFLKNDKTPYITITTPYADSTNFNIKTSTGNIAVTDLNFEGNVKSSTGDIRINNGSIGNVDISTSTGDITVFGIESVSINVNTSTGETKLSNTTISDKFYVKTSTGDVTMSNGSAARFEVEGSTSDVTVNNTEINNVKISVSTGDVQLGLAGEESNYSFDLHSSTGDIDLGNSEFEKSFTRETSGNGSIYVHTSTGDIDIDFTK